MSFYFIIFVIAFFVLARASGFLVRSLIGIARLFKMSEFIVAFIFMSMATSVPEFFVGLSSAIKGIPEFSLGNILGANLVNITLAVAVVGLLSGGLRVQSRISKRNFLIVSALAFFPILLGLDGVISRGDGAILLILFAFYLFSLLREREYFSKTVNNLPLRRGHLTSVLRHFVYFSLGVALLILSSLIIVWSGEILANRTILNLLSFGAIFVAIGTTLPEMAFRIRAARTGHDSMVIGNSLGSVAFNASLIVGVVSLIHPIHIIASFNLIAIGLFLLLAFALLNFFVFSRSSISRGESLILLLVYLMFLVFEYFEYFV